MDIRSFGISSVIEQKENYNISFICATTYSLETDILPAFLIPLYPEECSILPRIISRAQNDNRLVVFYDRDHLKNISCKNSKIDQLMQRLVKQCCKPVMISNGCFHPKMILICYECISDPGKYLYRLSVASRNLTKSSMDENIVILETYGTEHSCPQNDPGELLDILSDLRFENGTCLYFQYPPAQNNMGNLRIIEVMDTKDIENLICISPGFTETDKLFGTVKNKHFFHKENSHAKVYHITRKNNSCEIWLGSANCSSKGLGLVQKCNSEAIVKIPTRLSSDRFIEYLNDYTHIDDPENKNFDSDPDKKGIEACIRSIRSIIISGYDRENNIITAIVELDANNIEPADLQNIKFIICEKADSFFNIIKPPNYKTVCENDITYVKTDKTQTTLEIRGVTANDISPIFTLICTDNENGKSIIRSLFIEMDPEVENIYSILCDETAKDMMNDIRLLISSLSSESGSGSGITRTPRGNQGNISASSSDELYEMIFNLFVNTPPDSISSTVDSLKKMINYGDRLPSNAPEDVKTLYDIIRILENTK